jgi:hypothetical protein
MVGGIYVVCRWHLPPDHEGKQFYLMYRKALLDRTHAHTYMCLHAILYQFMNLTTLTYMYIKLAHAHVQLFVIS